MRAPHRLGLCGAMKMAHIFASKSTTTSTIKVRHRNRGRAKLETERRQYLMNINETPAPAQCGTFAVFYSDYTDDDDDDASPSSGIGAQTSVATSAVSAPSQSENKLIIAFTSCA